MGMGELVKSIGYDSKYFEPGIKYFRYDSEYFYDWFFKLELNHDVVSLLYITVTDTITRSKT